MKSPHKFRGVEVRGSATLMGASEVTSQTMCDLVGQWPLNVDREMF